MDLATISLLVLAPLILLRGKSSSNSKSKYVEYKYEPQPQGSVRDELDNYLQSIEKNFELDGLRDYFMSAGWVESRFLPSAHRPEPEGYKLVYKPPKYIEPLDKFKDNPWINNKTFWNATGGLWQLFAGNALNTNDGKALNLDPKLIYNWKYSLAFAIDFAYRLNKKYSAKNWLLIRYGWSSLSLLNNYNTISTKKASQVKGRLLEGAQHTNSNPESFNIKPNFSKYSEFQFEGMLEFIMHF